MFDCIFVPIIPATLPIRTAHPGRFSILEKPWNYLSYRSQMKFRKIPVSITDQITLLKSRGLVFHDEALAQVFLSTISYYRLRAYTYPFQDNANPDHPFIKPVSFEEIIDLYKFDDKLRLLVFNALGQIEIAMRTQIIYHFALGYGSHWHLRPELYRNPMWFANHLDSLQKEIDRSNEAFIEHYKETSRKASSSLMSGWSINFAGH